MSNTASGTNTKSKKAAEKTEPVKKYSLTDEHRAMLPSWRQKWIDNAMSTAAMTDEDRVAVKAAIKGLYEAADLPPPPPERILFVSSPIVAHFAASFAAEVWAKRDEAKGKTKSKDALDAVISKSAQVMSQSPEAAAPINYGQSVHQQTLRAAIEAALTDDQRDTAGDFVRGIAHAASLATGGAGKDAGAVSDARVAELLDDEKMLAHPWCTPLGSVMREAAKALDCDVKNAHQAFSMRNGGNQWSGWVAFLSFFRHIVQLPIDYSKWQHYEEAAARSGPRYMHSEFCIVSDRPEVLTVDAQNRPHNETGPFCRWRDGVALYAFHGVRVPRYVIERPDLINVERIHAERNEEIRRVMIERFGVGRYVTAAGFKVVDEDKDPLGLPRRLLRRDNMLVVELTNSTLDADGTRRTYFVACEPSLRPMLPDGRLGEPQSMTALNAVASTYGMRGEEYKLEVET